jgi:large subunit ribosomal protein L10
MPRPEKVQAVEQIREQLDGARATFVTEYRGLTVGEQQELRRSVQKAQGEYQVFKMSLARRAVEGMSLEGLPDLLVGPTALAFAKNDPVPVAKVLKDFASAHDKLIIKGGILGGALLPPEQISRLADIESRDVLLSKIAGGFKAPLSKLAGMLGAKMRDAASMFSQLLEKKEAEAPETEEVPVAVAEPTEVVVEEAPAAVAEEAPAAVVEEVAAAVAEEAPAAVAEEAPAAVVEEVAAAVAEEAPAAVVEEVAEVVAEEAPAAVVAEPTEVVVEEAPASVVAEPTEVVAEEAPAAVVAEPTEVVVEEAPAIEADTTGGAVATKKPAPRKKAAPKAKAEKSSANADADQAPVDGSDDTAEEE